MPYQTSRLRRATDEQAAIGEAKLPDTRDEKGKELALEQLQQQLNKVVRQLQEGEIP
jgi:hypothetical protein